MNWRKPSLITLAVILGLLSSASTIEAKPFQNNGRDTIRAIGVRPIEPEPVRTAPVVTANPSAQNPSAAIGVGPKPQRIPPQAPQQVAPVPQNPVFNYPSNGVQPTPQIPTQPSIISNGVGYPVGEIYPQPALGVVVPQSGPGYSSPAIAQPNPQPVRASVNNLDKQRVIVGLQNLINQQAALGQFPHNNEMLSDILALITKHSRPILSKVKVVNNGPGTLRVTHPDGSTTDVPPNFNLEISVGSKRVSLSAEFQNVLISFEHLANEPARFWDQDDQTHVPIAPSIHGPAHKPHHTLIPGVWGHHLTL